MVRWYSNDLKELALSMSLQGLHDSEIHQFTGISVRLLKRFCSTLHQTGGISAPPPIDNGQPRLLTAVQLKVTRHALEHNKQDHEEYRDLITTHFCPDQLVFADESHFNQLTLRRLYAWSIHSECACQYEFFFRSTKYLMLPAISLGSYISRSSRTPLPVTYFGNSLKVFFHA